MKRARIGILLLALLLTGCGNSAGPETAVETMAPEELQQSSRPLEPAAARPEKSELRITVQSKTDILPVTLYAGQGYSIYIADEGWRLEQDADSGVREDTWESTAREGGELKVSIYPGVDAEAAKGRMLEEEEAFFFENAVAATGVLGDPLRGRDDRGREMLYFMVAERNGDAYVISWRYLDQVADLYGAQLRQMADTFWLTE